MRVHGAWALAAVVMAATVVLASSSQDQRPASPATRRPTFRAGANHVRVDVYPTVDGQVVRGLNADDLDVRNGATGSRVTDALAVLTRIRRDAPVRALAGYAWRPTAGGSPQAALWVAGEFDAGVAARDEQWEDGADVSVEVMAPGGSVVDAAHQTLTRDSRSFVVRLPAAGGVGPGEYEIRFTSKASGASLGSTETLRVTVPKLMAGEEPLVSQPVIFRRGPFTGTAWMPAADLRFRRQERIKVETVVLGAAAPVAVRLLDRTGSALPLPVIAAERDEGGARIVSGEVALAPLTAGDYLLETTVTSGATTRTVLAAFRIVP